MWISYFYLFIYLFVYAIQYTNGSTVKSSDLLFIVFYFLCRPAIVFYGILFSDLVSLFIFLIIIIFMLWYFTVAK